MKDQQPYYDPSYSSLTPFELVDHVLLDNREAYITITGILRSYYGLQRNNTVKGSRGRDSVNEAVKKIKRVLKNQGLSLDYANGHDCSKGFRYPKEAADPMSEERNASKKMRLKQLERLIRNSKGLFPATWLADLVGKKAAQPDGEEPIIFFDGNLQLNGIEHLPVLYDAIEKRQVVRFRYDPGYHKEIVALTVNPYRLKEYNQRWFLFCESEKVEGKTYGICALDRIEDKVEVLDDAIYKPCKKGAFGEAYFKDIIGVTRLKGRIEHIVLECHDEKTIGRLLSKPLHRSQHVKEEDGTTYISLDVIPNDELYSQLLGYGPAISVLYPLEVRNEIAQRISKMLEHYPEEDGSAGLSIDLKNA